MTEVRPSRCLTGLYLKQYHYRNIGCVYATTFPAPESRGNAQGQAKICYPRRGACGAGMAIVWVGAMLSDLPSRFSAGKEKGEAMPAEFEIELHGDPSNPAFPFGTISSFVRAKISMGLRGGRVIQRMRGTDLHLQELPRGSISDASGSPTTRLTRRALKPAYSQASVEFGTMIPLTFVSKYPQEFSIGEGYYVVFCTGIITSVDQQLLGSLAGTVGFLSPLVQSSSKNTAPARTLVRGPCARKMRGGGTTTWSLI